VIKKLSPRYKNKETVFARTAYIDKVIGGEIIRFRVNALGERISGPESFIYDPQFVSASLKATKYTRGAFVLENDQA
jgi:hypothetical protein